VARTRKKEKVDPLHNRVSIEYVDINEIYPYADNPRENTNAVESVANSIRAFGFQVPIVIDRAGTIVAGHTRHAAALRIGMTEVPVIRASALTDEQAKQFRIIDNKVSELARWDMDLLSAEISALADSGIDFTNFGFTQEEVDCLSDMVANDCLSATGFMDEDERARAQRPDPRAPATARVVIGEFVFFLPMPAYTRWAREVRALNEFDEAAITADLQGRLGMTEYIEAER
jgi:hypothetical protein